jgi:hypothetical protein
MPLERKTMKARPLPPVRFNGGILAVLFALLGIAPAPAPAQAPDTAAGYPPQQIRFVVPFTAGGGTDVIMRIVAKHLSDNWKITALVDNRVGAGGVVGSQYVTTQKPDGRTFLAVASAFAVRAAIDRGLPYDATRDFSGVGQMARSPSFMVVSTSHGFNSLKELIAYAKKQPAGVFYTSAGVGSTAHLHAAAVAHLAGIKADHAPQRGTPEAVNEAMVGGSLHLCAARMRSAREGGQAPDPGDDFPAGARLPAPTRRRGYPGMRVTTGLRVRAGRHPAAIRERVEGNARILAARSASVFRARVRTLSHAPGALEAMCPMTSPFASVGSATKLISRVKTWNHRSAPEKWAMSCRRRSFS